MVQRTDRVSEEEFFFFNLFPGDPHIACALSIDLLGANCDSCALFIDLLGGNCDSCALSIDLLGAKCDCCAP